MPDNIIYVQTQKQWVRLTGENLTHNFVVGFCIVPWLFGLTKINFWFDSSKCVATKKETSWSIKLFFFQKSGMFSCWKSKVYFANQFPFELFSEGGMYCCQISRVESNIDFWKHVIVNLINLMKPCTLHNLISQALWYIYVCTYFLQIMVRGGLLASKVIGLLKKVKVSRNPSASW